MRYLGTLMLLACVAMLLFPSLWERPGPSAPGVHHDASPGRSTLSEDDLIPPWRGPAPRGEKDG